MTNPLLVGREERELLRVTLACGRAFTGRCTIVARRHYVLCPDPGNLLGVVEGPLEQLELLALQVLQTRAEAIEEGRQRLLGDRVPGPEPVTRDDYENRLRRIARAIALAKEDWSRECQLKRQFEELAARIALSAGKRQWLLNEERWRLRSNAEPTMADLWVGDMASPSCFARPRPQDFDPDPVVRRRRTPLPPAARADPHGLRNMLAAMLARGLKARLDRQGDPPHLRGAILVKIPAVKGRAQFVARAERESEDRPIVWRLSWDGNESKAGQRRYRAATQTPDYEALRAVLQTGRSGVQAELALRRH